MRPSEVLDPKRIKAARDAVGLTQMETAELVFPNSRGKTGTVSYQRIERTGKTSPKTAVKIAGCLNVTVDDLRPGQEWANTLWWISHEEVDGEGGEDGNRPEIGATHDGGSLSWELDRILKEYPLKFDHYGPWKVYAKCDFDGSAFHIRMSRRTNSADNRSVAHGICSSITIRSCKFHRQKGLLWCKPNEYLFEFIEKQIKNLLFSNADFVVMNGKAFPPHDVTACYYVAAHKSILRDGKIIIFRGKRLLMGRCQFICSFKEWLDNNPGAAVHKIVNGLTINPSADLKAGSSNAREPMEIDHQISVRYGWLDTNSGAFEEAPWPDYDRANLVVRKFIGLLPDIPGEIDDAEVLAFEPEMFEIGEHKTNATL